MPSVLRSWSFRAAAAAILPIGCASVPSAPTSRLLRAVAVAALPMSEQTLQGSLSGSTMGDMTEQLPGEIRTLSEEECWELVDASSVGRFGFVQDGDVKIIPVNYMVDVDLIIRTLPNGILSKLAGKRVTFEVDYHGSHGAGWSVLMHGPAAVLPDDEAELVRRWNRVLPWAGGNRSLFLSFTADSIQGRRVNRSREG